jgi:hypothetical protein
MMMIIIIIIVYKLLYTAMDLCGAARAFISRNPGNASRQSVSQSVLPPRSMPAYPEYTIVYR